MRIGEFDKFLGDIFAVRQDYQEYNGASYNALRKVARLISSEEGGQRNNRQTEKRQEAGEDRSAAEDKSNRKKAHKPHEQTKIVYRQSSEGCRDALPSPKAKLQRPNMANSDSQQGCRRHLFVTGQMQSTPNSDQSFCKITQES